MADTTARQMLLLRAADAVREYAASGCGPDSATAHQAVKEALEAGITLDEIAKVTTHPHH
ncbi:hypothetical protein ACXZ65_34385 [Streptomyces aculeolatus]